MHRSRLGVVRRGEQPVDRLLVRVIQWLLVVRVVDDLILRRRVSHHIVVFGDAVEDAGVTVRLEIPFERQLEISELVDASVACKWFGVAIDTMSTSEARRMSS